MAIYAIGDIQGCYDSLLRLLDTFNYDEHHDTIWFTGDLVNRGIQSLKVLQFVKQLPNVISVLGNHDLAMLALAYANISLADHTLSDVLSFEGREELFDWLRHLPLLHHDPSVDAVLVHAGISPAWSLAEAKHYATEVETQLQGPDFIELLHHMFGNQPNTWQPTLQGWDRYRYIINAFTRMRFCDTKGELNFKYKGPIKDAPKDLYPWFELPNRSARDIKIVFGHWAALAGKTKVPNIFPLDTGCVWGGELTAMRLDDNVRFSVACQPPC